VRIGCAITKVNSTELKDTEIASAKKMWSKVNAINGKQTISSRAGIAIDPTKLNAYYAAISTDRHYVVPLVKRTCAFPVEWPTEYSVFVSLDKLKHTATGHDDLPWW